MSTVQIVGKEYYCKDIFDRFRFFIPRYQRPYAWTTENAEELLDDLWAAYTADSRPVADKDPYFLGSIVLIKQEHHPQADVIDGQQRLTTLTILLSALRELLPDSADAISDYLRQKGRPLEGLKDEFRLTLRAQDAAFFEKYIQQSGGFNEFKKVNGAALPNDAQRNIRANALYLLERLSTKPPGQLPSFPQFIVTKCIMVVVSTPDMESAYRIFSVMNDRGLDLSHADILKAEVIGAIAESQQDVYGQKWEAAEDSLGRSAFDELFAHIRMIHVKQKMRSTILKEIRQSIAPTKMPIAFIDQELEPYADALRIIKRAEFQSTQGAETVNTYLRWLNRVDNIDWIPPAILALAHHESDSAWLASFFSGLERLAAALLVLRAGINDRLERYGKVLSALQDGEDVLAPKSELSLTDEERSKVLKGLDGNLYEMTKVRAYVMLRLDRALSGGGAIYDYPIVTIEHVLPQTPAKGSKWLEWFPDEKQRAEWVHRIGNLVLLSRNKNSEAQNFDFAKKTEKYFKSDKGISPFVLTTQVLAQTEWTPAVLKARQEALVGKLKEIWSL